MPEKMRMGESRRLTDRHDRQYTRSRGKLDPIVHTFSSVNQAMAAAMTQAAEESSTILDRWRAR
jgi:hypothetical protein